MNIIYLHCGEKYEDIVEAAVKLKPEKN